MYIQNLIPMRSEHLLSYLARTSIANRLPSLSALYVKCGVSEQCNGFSLDDFDNQRSTLDRIADWIGVDYELLTNLIPAHDREYCRYLGMELPANIIHFDRVRCCPQCLKERGKIAAYYALRPISMCLRHRVSLVETWQDGSVIEWGDNDLYERICECECIVPELSWEQEELSIHTGRLLKGQYTKTLSDEFGLMDAANFLTLLLFSFNHSYRHPEVSDNEFWAECYQTLQHSPLSIFEFIEVLNDAGLGMTFRNFAAIYPDSYADLYRGPFCSSYAYMKLQQLLENNLSGLSRG